MLNKGRRFIREFSTISEINDFCSLYSCVPINIIPVVIQTTYKKAGATQALNTMIPKYSYATILQPVEDGLTSDEIEREIQSIDNGMGCGDIRDTSGNPDHADRDDCVVSVKTKKSPKRDDKYSKKESGKDDSLTLNKLKYTQVAEMLHLSDAEKQRSKEWFMQNKNKSFSSYCLHMGLQEWQKNILAVMCNDS